MNINIQEVAQEPQLRIDLSLADLVYAIDANDLAWVPPVFQHRDAKQWRVTETFHGSPHGDITIIATKIDR